MARSVKRPRAEPQAFHQLGVRGRKTGVVLQDRGVRDEHGMQPIDSIFSPHEGRPASSSDIHDDHDGSDNSGSVEMDIETSAGPGPQTLLKNRMSNQFPIPKSRSPIKTFLNSPAKRNPHLDHFSSPSRSGIADDRDVTVTRRLDFTAKTDKSRRLSDKSMTNGSQPSRASFSRSLQHDLEEEEEDEGGEDVSPPHPTPRQPKEPTLSDMVEDSLQMVAAMSDNYTGAGFDQQPGDQPPETVDEYPEYEEPPQRQRRVNPSPVKPSPLRFSTKPPQKPQSPGWPQGSRKRPLDAAIEKEEPITKRRGDRDGDSRQKQVPAVRPPPPRPGSSLSRVTTAPKVEEKPVKRGRGRPRKTDRPQKPAATVEEGEGDESFMEIQRGPPMPRSRGLVSFRHGNTSNSKMQAGRRSTRPLDYWRDDPAILGEDGLPDQLPDDFAQPPMKDVVRMPEDAPPSRRAPRSQTRLKAKARYLYAVEEDEELEDWEMNEGAVNGDIVLWEPEHEDDPPGDDDQVQVTEDRLALSADAIQTQEIKDATFRFVKTLTLPFIGAGVVDLPPGAEKRPKNSRKMHMVFFVHYGKVLVTINEAQFRISAGGTWFVPRGNYYSIMNDYDVPARIFFAQACQWAPRPEVPDE